MHISKYSDDFNYKQTKFCEYMHDFNYPETQVHFHIFGTEYRVMHSHDYWEFFLILSGSIMHKTPISSEKLSAGDLVLVRPSDKHCFVKPMEEGYQQLNVMITDKLFRELTEVINPNLYSMIINQIEPIKFFADDQVRQDMLNTVHLIQMLEEKDYVNYVSLIKLMYFSVLNIAYKKLLHINNSYPDWLNEFLAEIKKPSNIGLKVDELYKFTNFSHSHLIRLFKQYTGKTMIDYLIDLKMSFAANLLVTTDFSTLDISSKIGYDSLSHFNRIFKKYFNKTPSEYRKKIKNT